MPIYAYACDACAHRQDHLQKMADAVLTLCPSCGAAAYTKQLSAPPFQLKGGGWYVTDFRDSGKKDTKKSDADGKSGEGSTSAKADAKAESKSDSKSDTASAASTASGTPAGSTAAASSSSSPSSSSTGDAKAA